MVLFLSVSLPVIFYFVWFVFLVCVYYVYLYMGQVPELKLMMMMMIVLSELKLVDFVGVIYGLKWNTNNMAEVGVTFEDKPVQGITTTAELQFIPLTG